MSLAGNLSDLSLPELLQVVALSRKTGALEICSEHGGVAWLGLRDGGIVRVALESGDLDRDEILKRAGLEAGGDPDVAAATLWDAAVQAILGIFDWSEGDFTFEPHDDPALQWRGPQGILLPSPLSPEFLALEGARLEDENAAQSADLGFPCDDPGAPIIEPPPEEEAPPELEALPRTHGRAEDDTPFRLRTDVLRREGNRIYAPPPRSPDPDATVVQGSPRNLSSDSASTMEMRRPTGRLPTSLICIDADLPLLERIKAGLSDKPIRTHIFQSPADALARFKQYVIRGEVPGILLGSAVEDPLDARQGLGWRRFAGRLLAIAPRLRLVVLARPGENVAAPGLAVVQRPDARPSAGDVEIFVRALTDALAASA